MKIRGFIWLESFVEKLDVKHDVTVDEVEELFWARRNLQLRRVKRGHYRGEHVYRALGQTATGRHLAVFFILKRSGEALVISARDMDKKERRTYAKRI